MVRPGPAARYGATEAGGRRRGAVPDAFPAGRAAAPGGGKKNAPTLLLRRVSQRRRAGRQRAAPSASPPQTARARGSRRFAPPLDDARGISRTSASLVPDDRARTDAPLLHPARRLQDLRRRWLETEAGSEQCGGAGPGGELRPHPRAPTCLCPSRLLPACGRGDRQTPNTRLRRDRSARSYTGKAAAVSLSESRARSPDSRTSSAALLLTRKKCGKALHSARGDSLNGVTANLDHSVAIKDAEETLRLRRERSSRCLQKPLNPQEGNLLKTLIHKDREDRQERTLAS
ncbi:uncharacterized protein LOC123946293 [Meles meles]|uniref:uncharacterized protein LOC123946293 n=1 Tax=Meles meles TaxID=9662 RepID=UPI001E69CEA4|nr:uncharacterized protein LOC123946293 [Meles meles]